MAATWSLRYAQRAAQPHCDVHLEHSSGPSQRTPRFPSIGGGRTLGIHHHRRRRAGAFGLESFEGLVRPERPSDSFRWKSRPGQRSGAFAGRTASDGNEAGLRPWPVRRLHGPGRRPAGSFLSHPGSDLGKERSGHDRGTGIAGQWPLSARLRLYCPPSDRVPGVHVGPAHVRGRFSPGAVAAVAGGDSRGDVGKSLPLRSLSENCRGDRRRPGRSL